MSDAATTLEYAEWYSVTWMVEIVAGVKIPATNLYALMQNGYPVVFNRHEKAKP